MNTLFPAFLKLHQLPVLLVGGGRIGLEKLNTVLINSPEAQVTVLAPSISPEMVALARSHQKVKLCFKPFEVDDLNEIRVVIAATSNRVLNKTVYDAARTQHVLINVADMPEWCDFYLGSVVRKGDLKMAISTNGKSPMLARRLRQYFEALLPDSVDGILLNLHFIRGRMGGDLSQKIAALKSLTEVVAYDRKEGVSETSG